MFQAKGQFGSFGVFGAMVGTVVAVSVCAGQASTIDQPYYGVISVEGASLRSGDLETYYVIEPLQEGTVLLVDSKAGGYLRVSYPLESWLYVSSDQGTISSDTRTFQPSSGATLKAPNTKFGLKGSWRSVPVVGPMPAELRVLGSEPSADGSTTIYRVAAPASARAFVREDSLRKADDSAIESYLAAGGHKLEQSTPSDTPTPHDDHSSQTQPRETEAADQPTDPAVTSNEPTGASSVPEGNEAAAQTDPLTGLLDAFDAVRVQPVLSAEVGELIAEFEKAIAELPQDNTGETTRLALDQRLRILKVTKGIQEQQRLLEQTQQQARQSSASIDQQLDVINSSQAFTVVGRLTTSAVYDGKNRPLMFRVEAVGTPIPRTLGYLKPDDRLKLDDKLGQIIGVVGESQIQSDTRLNIITPSRIETLSPPTGG